MNTKMNLNGFIVAGVFGYRFWVSNEPCKLSAEMRRAMKTKVLIIVSFIVSLAIELQSFAKDCYSDLDCDMYRQERCIIPSSERVGVCVKSESHREKERKPVSDTPAPSPLKRGQFCMIDKDCDPGQACIKKENALTGTCR